MPRFLHALAVLMVLAPAAQAQYDPPRGSAERTAILDAARSTLRQKVDVRGTAEFRNVTMRVSGNYAFVDALAYVNGRPSQHCQRADPAMPGDENIITILYRRGSRWTVLDQGSCATDVWYVDWSRFGWDAARVVGTTSGPPAVPRMTTIARIDDGFLALRSVPSLSRGERLTRMPSGSRVRVLACQDAPERIDGVWDLWCRVQYGSQTGWAAARYLD